MARSRPAVVVAADPGALVREAAAYVRAAAGAALARRGRFRLALSGGTTPRALYQALAADHGGVDWTRTDVFFGDERAVPPDHPASNYRMARETLLEPAAVPVENVHRMRAEAADLDAAARAYEAELAAAPARPWLDLALLGLGPDGHTASLFPGTPAASERQRLCVAADVPQLGLRLTLTLSVFLDAHEVAFLVAGPEKAQALREVLAAGEPARPLAARVILQRSGPVTVFCDRGAASLLAPDGVREG